MPRETKTQTKKPPPRHAPEPAGHFARNRVVVIAASLLAMVVAAALVWLAMGTLSKTTASPMFPILQVTFAGEMQRVDKADLESVAGGIRGSMLHTDLNDVKAAIKQVHWVRNADVRRRFPSTLEVSVEEHLPFAKWKNGDGERSTFVNNFGEVFEAEFDGPLPVLSGPEGTAKEVLAQYDTFKSVLAGIGQTPAAVTLSARRAWQLRLANGASLELGRAEAVERLNRYVAAYAVVPALQAANVRIDMRYQSGMALKLADADLAGLAPATARKTIKKPMVKL